MLSVKAQFKIVKEPPDEGRLHLFLFSLKEVCSNLVAAKGFESLRHSTFAKVAVMKLALWFLAVLAAGVGAAE